MSYYIFEAASDTPETGAVYPQASGMLSGYDYSSSRSIHKLRDDQLPDFEPDLDSIILEKRAKLTDLVSTVFSSSGFLVSERMKSLLEQFRLPICKFHKAKINYKEKVYDNYFWFQPIGDLSAFINYRETKFYAKDDFSKNVEKIEASDLKELREEWAKVGYTKKIVTEKVIFNNNFDINLDLFKVGFDYRTFISQSLHDKLIANKLTGIETRPITFI